MGKKSTSLVWHIFLFDVSTGHAGTRKLDIHNELLDRLEPRGVCTAKGDLNRFFKNLNICLFV